MNTREKVIVGVMLAVVVYGAVSFIGRSAHEPQTDPDAELTELNTFIASVAATLKRQAALDSRRILEKAATPWASDPFAAITESSGKAAAAKPDKQPQATSFSYSGYIRSGDQYVAIINGIEYEVGDIVTPSPYVVGRITSEEVVLKGPENEALVLGLEKTF